ncbi:protein kinase rio1, partial [Gonapodya sp. JEL0774]
DLTKKLNRARNEVAGGAVVGNSGARLAGAGAAGGTARTPVKNKAAVPAVREAKEKQYSALAKKYGARIHVDDDLPASTSQSVVGALQSHSNRTLAAEANRTRDRSDRATVDSVLDQRTRAVLLKMVQKGVVGEVNGCVSAGKEANVYHALTTTNQPLAIKIYRTSILSFRSRDHYISGEHRFRQGYAKHNTRKMVTMWAEKEARNLKRMEKGGVRGPKMYEVRGNVVVMEMVGDGEGK